MESQVTDFPGGCSSATSLHWVIEDEESQQTAHTALLLLYVEWNNTPVNMHRVMIFQAWSDKHMIM